ncbi:MAG: hypothetical protein QW348_04840 [Ignisphaera sp.]
MGESLERVSEKMIVEVDGVDYGYSLYYSYLLPLFDIEPTENGFVFRKVVGFCSRIECVFHRDSLKTVCKIPPNCVEYSKHVLGIDSRWGFKELCRVYGYDNCVAEKITLIYSPKDARLVFYTILLSRNTDYFVNTLRWLKELVYTGGIRGGSYITKQFLEIRESVDRTFDSTEKIDELAISLLRLRYVGLKTVSAFLLHAFGLTEHAPIDRHYMWYLSRTLPSFKYVQIRKEVCIRSKLNCFSCPYRERCLYGATKIFGKLNGYIQSLAYLSKRMSMARNTIEEILVPRGHRDIRSLENIVKAVIEKVVGDANKNAGLRPFPTW